jgi:hypothetical protein
MLDSPVASAVSRAIDRAASGQLSTSDSGTDERASNKRKACTSLTVRKVRPGNRDANGKRRANAFGHQRWRLRAARVAYCSLDAQAVIGRFAVVRIWPWKLSKKRS